MVAVVIVDVVVIADVPLDMLEEASGHILMLLEDAHHGRQREHLLDKLYEHEQTSNGMLSDIKKTLA